MTVLALKLLLDPLLVVASSLAGRRWGPRVAGILVVLPIVAGPILLILYLDHGSGFAAAAARAATLAIVPLALFALIFAYVSRNHGWLLTLLASWVAVLLGASRRSRSGSDTCASDRRAVARPAGSARSRRAAAPTGPTASVTCPHTRGGISLQERSQLLFWLCW
jgi:hypothetical protein